MSFWELQILELGDSDVSQYDDELNELVGFGCIESYDYEVERTWTEIDDNGCLSRMTDDSTDTAMPYYTTSGDRPVLYAQAEVNDQKRSSGGYSDVAHEGHQWGRGPKTRQRAKLARQVRHHLLGKWMERHPREALVALKGIQSRLARSRQECGTNGDWSGVYLTKAQLVGLIALCRKVRGR